MVRFHWYRNTCYGNRCLRWCSPGGAGLKSLAPCLSAAGRAGVAENERKPSKETAGKGAIGRKIRLERVIPAGMNPDPTDLQATVGDGEPRCPQGIVCELRVVNRKQMLAECAPAAPSYRCPEALWFGGAFYCRSLWQLPAGKTGSR